MVSRWLAAPTYRARHRSPVPPTPRSGRPARSSTRAILTSQRDAEPPPEAPLRPPERTRALRSERTRASARPNSVAPPRPSGPRPRRPRVVPDPGPRRRTPEAVCRPVPGVWTQRPAVRHNGPRRARPPGRVAAPATSPWPPRTSYRWIVSLPPARPGDPLAAGLFYLVASAPARRPGQPREVPAAMPQAGRGARGDALGVGADGRQPDHADGHRPRRPSRVWISEGQNYRYTHSTATVPPRRRTPTRSRSSRTPTATARPTR